MFVKLCGFTNPYDIEIIQSLPIASVGFIFYKKSKRYVKPNHAKKMSSMLNGSNIKSTGVFVDDDPVSIMKIVEEVNLDMIQVYDKKTAHQLASTIPVIECVRIGSQDKGELPIPHPGGFVLFDTYSAVSYGGTGKCFNHDLIRDYPFKNKMIIAGGINIDNIKPIIINMKPAGIDISSGIEISEGIKSKEKILKILQFIKEAEYDINT